jgi:UDP-glucose 4-epimerase
MRILLTGGAGYIGSVTSRLLLEADHEVLVLDNLSHGHENAVPSGAIFLNGDIEDITSLLKGQKPVDAVIHLAAYIAAGESMEKPELYWQNNTVKTFRMLEAMRQLDIKKLVFASTAAVYGDPVGIPISEDDPKNPTNTYGMTKLAMDMAITSECWAHDLAATSVRFFNVAGAHGDAGERHPVETHLIPIALQAAAGDREGISLFGTDYDTKDGTCIRDYIHVADLARAMILALDKLEAGKHTVYNLGNGHGFTNREVLAAVEKVTGKKLNLREEPRREGDPAVLVASSQRAFEELGWKPERPNLEDIIADAWEFYIKTKQPTGQIL